ncbi:putative selenate reductase subunit YgfK [Clostridium tagluense]|uniref:putative selenate reductase subunit YgfK n=1 Tax=Clostridium tagluense TaxID=360422 RepID=UPI001C6E21FC|nr:putative selenate reductase subunit YgfK [Clostridium tagluense]MBW9156804.1 putative selenate reductase subunit YgfK [Clostridium tagluense]WLC66286.1 putative selenate reductase subunit YgfK [Clostridium tagluense]
MGDRMTPIPFKELMEWIIEENKKYGKIFGVNKFFKKQDDKVLEIFGEKIETPFGPAAGPHTQLAQNIIAAYVSGCRFFELKTVQTLDGEDLPVSKPCIKAEDECYNVEWSTELRVQEAYAEYIKAWFALKILSKELELGSPDGFIFNMSVGYDFEGISSPKIDEFIMGLKDASKSNIWSECTQYVLDNIEKFKNIDKEYVESISPRVCRSITLSTLHGCPSKEIEHIATYLLNEKGLNTYVKCNPTLLGYEFVRKTLDSIGFDYVSFDEHHFQEDLQFDDAIVMFRKLQDLASQKGLSFGVKLTNTFPALIKNAELPGDEMYMSGKSLYPLSIAMASRLSNEFDGKLKISYSGGADFFNINSIFETGIWPITIATTMLKVGGYQRCVQIAEKLSKLEYANKYVMNNEKLNELKDESVKDIHHIKPIKPNYTGKINKKVPLADCFISACEEGCPISQDIPEYINFVDQGKYLEALRVIVEKNPLPFITGTICSHACMGKCTRNFCDESVNIRNIKLQAAENAYEDLLNELVKTEKSGGRVAIVGGGTTGLAAAYFLAREGMDVTIFEKRNALGGIVKHIVPEFRLPHETVQKDIDLVCSLGVKVELNSEQNSVENLKKLGYKYVLFAIGAWKPGKLNIEGENVINVLQFLERLRSKDSTLNLGKNVVVVGGGNTAMDAARAAKRAEGVENVYLVYRRTKKYMPADMEELQLAIEEGVEFKELLAPVKITKGVLSCEIMELAEPDESGRRRPVASGKMIDIQADIVISAVGEKVDAVIFKENNINVNEKEQAIVDVITLETNIKGVYVAGDGLHGPATVVEGIADATKVARAVVKQEKNHDFTMRLPEANKNIEAIIAKKGILKMSLSGKAECERCLQCSTVCEACVDVCPNRANIAIKVKGNSMHQIIHVDKMCNECGNCEMFCPYDSAPYKEKFTLFAKVSDFENSENMGFVLIDSDKKIVRVRLQDEVLEVNLNSSNTGIPKDIENMIWAVISNYNYMV